MRLIDADALIRFIDPEHLRYSGVLAFSEVDVINMVNQAPTAYDVGKVVERIENIKNNESGACINEDCWHCKYSHKCWDGEMGYFVALDKAIEFIKGGGVDGKINT